MIYFFCYVLFLESKNKKDTASKRMLSARDFDGNKFSGIKIHELFDSQNTFFAIFDFNITFINF